MKPKIQMRIGLFGAIALAILGVYQFICHITSGSFALSKLLGTLVSLIILGIYIFGIIRREHKTAQVAYRFWWISTVVLLGLMF